RQGNAHLQIVPYQLFATADGWLVLAVGNDGQWQRFCDCAGRADLAADTRFTTNTLRVENRAVLVPLVEEVLRSRTTTEAEKVLLAPRGPNAPVWNYAELFRHPQTAARGLRLTVHDPQGRPVDLVGSPFHMTGAKLPAASAPPALGQDTDRVLQELLGLDAERLGELRRQGVI